MAFGVTPAGFVAKQQQDIITEMQQSFQGALGQNLNFLVRALIQNIINIVSEREALVWQLAEAVYNSEYPDTAEGVSLDNVGAISGIPRLGALPSRALAVRLFGTAGTVVPAGTQFSVDGSPSSVFAMDNSVTLVAGQDSIQHLAFSLVPTSGQWKLSWGGRETAFMNFNAAAATVQSELRALLFGGGAVVTGDYTAGFDVDWAGVSGLQVQPTIIVSENTLEASATPVDVTVTETQPGVNQGTVDCTATLTGPVIADADTLTVIDTPVSGLNSVLNVTDAVVGRDVESDSAYRLRRATELQIAGAGTVEAIRSKLQSVAGVTAVIVFENDSLIPDLAGRPPKSFEAVVQGGTDDDIANELWLVKPAGIMTDGTVTVPITDSQGQTHDINFSRPTPLLVYVALDLTIDATFPANGAASARQAIVDAGNALGIGKEVITIPYLISALAGIPGIQDAVLNIGLAPSPSTPDNIPVAPNEVAEFDTSRVNVVTHT